MMKDNTGSSKQFLTPQQLATYLEVPVKTLYGWRYQRKGPPGFRVGRHLRHLRSDVQRWIEGQSDVHAWIQAQLQAPK